MPSLIIRLPNHLGDACMALPALDLLAAQGVSLTLVGRAWATELFAAHPWPAIGLPGARMAGVAALRKLRASHPGPHDALLLTNSFSSALEFRLAGLRPGGYARDGRSLLLRRAISVPQAWYGDMHTIEYYLHLVRAYLNLAASDAPAAASVPRLALTADARARAAAALALAGVAAGAQPNYVVLCPVAQGRHRGQNKCWDGYARLGRQLRERGLAVVICPGPGEAAAATAAVPDARVVGALDLGGFAALLARSCLVVANDSGPGHLAAAVGARLVGVFGVTDPSKTCPRGPGVHIAGGAAGWPSYEEVAALVLSLLPAASPPAGTVAPVAPAAP